MRGRLLRAIIKATQAHDGEMPNAVFLSSADAAVLDTNCVAGVPVYVGALHPGYVCILNTRGWIKTDALPAADDATA